MATPEEQAICTAPKGKIRVVHVDPRDHWPTKKADVDTIGEVEKMFGNMLVCQQEVMAVFDDQGKRVSV